MNVFKNPRNPTPKTLIVQVTRLTGETVPCHVRPDFWQLHDYEKEVAIRDVLEDEWLSVSDAHPSTQPEPDAGIVQEHAHRWISPDDGGTHCSICGAQPPIDSGIAQAAIPTRAEHEHSWMQGTEKPLIPPTQQDARMGEAPIPHEYSHIWREMPSPAVRFGWPPLKHVQCQQCGRNELHQAI